MIKGLEKIINPAIPKYLEQILSTTGNKVFAVNDQLQVY